MSSKKLAGKVAVITGGNSGIGLATAQLFHAEGAKVAIMGRDQKSIDTALKTLSTDSLGFAGDVSSLKDLETFMAKVNERFGRIDTLFVNAGVTSNGPTPVATASEDEFDRVFAHFSPFKKRSPICLKDRPSSSVLRLWTGLRWPMRAFTQQVKLPFVHSLK